MEKTTVLLFSLLLLLVFSPASSGLEVGFYNNACPFAERTVSAIVLKRFILDNTVPAALLRMHFHDCFVHGCDASILIDSTSEQRSEKEADANVGTRHFDLIDEAKAALELLCPSTVSCADIIALATRDAVILAGGPSYAVPTGRRDGLVSRVEDVHMPGPELSIPDSIERFSARGLTAEDMVVLLGAHTVGATHCDFFRHRLLDFNGTGAPDPTMDPMLRMKLLAVCGPENLPIEFDPMVRLDRRTWLVVDNVYYKQIMDRKGVLEIDQKLANDEASSRLVAAFARDGRLWGEKFAEAMVKMGKIGVLEGSDGEVRRRCNAFNP